MNETLVNDRTAAPATPTDALAQALDALLAQAADSGDIYLQAKRALRAGPAELLRVYQHVREALQGADRLLDWGCRHAALSMLARTDLGAAVELHGCDVCAPDLYAALHRRSGLHYRPITHPWNLDYPDQYFDAVIAGGTLEHVPNDGASLTELWRVLKPDGALLITHLPNAGSWSEFVSRRCFPQQAHQRRYRLKAFRQRLLQHGFETIAAGYHQLMPSNVPPGWARLGPLIDAIQPLNLLENRWPWKYFSATLWLVARRRSGF